MVTHTQTCVLKGFRFDDSDINYIKENVYSENYIIKFTKDSFDIQHSKLQLIVKWTVIKD